MEIKFSLFEDIAKTVGEECTIDDVVSITTSDVMKERIEKIRDPANAANRTNLKCQLPNITVNGLFSHRANEGITHYNQVTCMDIDHIPTGEMEKWKNTFKSQKMTLLMFVSPSGEGLKVFVRHDNTDRILHDNLYQQLVKLFKADLGCPYVDTVVHDLARATFLSYDANIYYNKDAEPFHFEYDSTLSPKPSPQAVSKVKTVQGQQTGVNPMTPAMKSLNASYQSVWPDKSLISYIDNHKWINFPEDYKEGHRNATILQKAKELCLCGVDYDMALAKLTRLYSEAFSNYPPCEVEKRVLYAYKTNQGDFGKDRQCWLDRRNNGIKKGYTSPFNP